jgi:succinoglycan biosynthesis transport protein ExoP
MNPTTDNIAIFAPLWKRKWLILLVAVLVGTATYFYYKHKATVYSVSTTLYIGAGAEEAGLLSGTGTSTNTKAQVTNTGTQVSLINTVVSESVHKALRSEEKLAAARGKVKAKAPEKSPFITITAQARTAVAASELANATAAAYIQRQRRSFQRAIEKALGIARRQLRRVEAAQAAGSKAKGGLSSSSVVQAAALSSKVNQLEAQLSVKGVQQLSPATPLKSQLVEPRPRKNAIFGFFLGLLLASAAAYLLGRFDRRLRSLADVETAFQAPILTALPVVRRPIVERDGKPQPSRPLLEPLRRLHTTLQLGSVGEELAPPRSILFVSADAGDGKSTLIANLARVQRDAGQRVAVIEADFRRPSQARLLRVDAQLGLADVLDGKRSAGEALQTVEPGSWEPSIDPAGAPAGAVTTVVKSPSVGRLSVLVSGGAVENPPAMLARPAMRELLSSVSLEFDCALIDAPPPLAVSDAMPLLSAVDGIVIVARVGHTREISIQRLMQLLLRSPGARVLGVVANSVPQKDIERYGFTAAPLQRRRTGR